MNTNYAQMPRKESLGFILNKAKLAIKNKGIQYFLTVSRNLAYKKIGISLLKLRKNKVFKFKDQTLKYCLSKISDAWTNERTIEIPLILNLLKNRTTPFLEIGNVLKQYKPSTWTNLDWTVVDKYEIASGVINDDITNYNPAEKFNLAISISTLEHVGWDERPQEPEKFLKAIKNILDNCLTKTGTLIFTVPLNCNTYLDGLLLNNQLQLTESHYFERISLNNQWTKTDKKTAFTKKYGLPYECANSLLLGIIKKEKNEHK